MPNGLVIAKHALVMVQRLSVIGGLAGKAKVGLARDLEMKI